MVVFVWGSSNEVLETGVVVVVCPPMQPGRSSLRRRKGGDVERSPKSSGVRAKAVFPNETIDASKKLNSKDWNVESRRGTQNE